MKAMGVKSGSSENKRRKKKGREATVTLNKKTQKQKKRRAPCPREGKKSHTPWGESESTAVNRTQGKIQAKQSKIIKWKRTVRNTNNKTTKKKKKAKRREESEKAVRAKKKTRGKGKNAKNPPNNLSRSAALGPKAGFVNNADPGRKRDGGGGVNRVEGMRRTRSEIKREQYNGLAEVKAVPTKKNGVWKEFKKSTLARTRDSSGQGRGHKTLRSRWPTERWILTRRNSSEKLTIGDRTRNIEGEGRESAKLSSKN